VRFDGRAPVAVWSILKPRTSVMLNDPSEAQNCVTVNHFAIGAFDGGMGERGGRLKFPTMRWDGYCTGARLIRRAASPPPITRRYGCAVRT
jgi:hypothetical protein